MSTTPNVLMLAPDGTVGYVPPQNVETAIANGGKVGVRMTSPDGTKGVIPFDQQDAAQKAGATWDVSPDNANVKTYMSWRQQAQANRPTDLLGRSANVPLTPPANLLSGPTISAQPDAGAKLASIPFARKLFDVVESLEEAANYTEKGKEQHPVQAELGTIADRLRGFLFGGAVNPANGIGNNQYGMVNNPALAAVASAPGAAELAGAAEGGIKAGISSLKSGVSAATSATETVEEAPSFVSQVVNAGTEKVAQVMRGTKAALTGAPETENLSTWTTFACASFSRVSTVVPFAASPRKSTSRKATSLGGTVPCPTGTAGMHSAADSRRTCTRSGWMVRRSRRFSATAPWR